MSQLVEQYRRALEGFGRRVHAVDADRWHDPTPDTVWDVRTLVGHLVEEQRWVAPLLAGSTPEDVGDRFEGDLLDDDPSAAWDGAAAEALNAWSQEGVLDRTVALSYGETPAADYLRQMTDDLVVHTWDLARAAGADERLDPDLVVAVRDRTDPDALARSGLFAAPVDVPADADPQTRLLAAYGRRA